MQVGEDMRMMNNLRPQRCGKCNHQLWVYARAIEIDLETKEERQGYIIIACPRCGIAALNKDAEMSR